MLIRTTLSTIDLLSVVEKKVEKRKGGEKMEHSHTEFHYRHLYTVLVGELPEESDQFRFLRAVHLTNLKGSVGLILVNVSTISVCSL